MDETNNKSKYLDFNGLQKYDKLIKSYIALGYKSLEDANVTLKGYVDDQVKAKQDIISDLDDIRSGAAAGATALQEVPTEYITEIELASMDYTTTTQVTEIIDNVIATSDDIEDMFK